MTPPVRSLALALLLLPSAALAQSRQIDWPTVAVTARLDSAGVLHIAERQTIRLSGDWNGAERSWDLRFGQTLSLRRLARTDSASGAEVELRADGDIDDVDEFDWSDNGQTLRWRARLQAEPPIENTLLTYLIETEHGRVLLPQPDGTYVLDHNFAMIDRQGWIERFDLTLTLDPAWSTRPDFTGTWRVDSLQPGQGFVVSIPLRFTAAGRPSSMRYGTPLRTRRVIGFALAAGLLVILLRLVVRERKLGRFAPFIPAERITPEWLGEHVLHMLPEVAGTAWDDHTSAPEVAATLARLVQEGKLSSRVETKKVLIFEQQVLHLTIETDRGAFREHERALIDSLFESHKKTTSTTEVRERYKTSGFDPASKISTQLKQIVAAGQGAAGGSKPAKLATLVLVIAAFAHLGMGIARDSSDGLFVAVGVMVSLFIYIISVALAAAFQRRVTGLVGWGIAFLLPIGLFAKAFGWFSLWQGAGTLGALTLTGFALLIAAYFNSVCNMAASRESAERIAQRKRLAAAREFFREELRKPQPRLQDA
jgi:hypothetical protein